MPQNKNHLQPPLCNYVSKTVDIPAVDPTTEGVWAENLYGATVVEVNEEELLVKVTNDAGWPFIFPAWRVFLADPIAQS